MMGLLPEDPSNSQPQQLRLNGYVLNASFEPGTPPSPAGGLVIATGPEEFIFAGIGVTVTFATTDPNMQAGLLSVEEGLFVNGQWQNIRWLNGDQTHQGRHMRLEPGRLSIQRVKLYRYR
jgi:hypothetical protein